MSHLNLLTHSAKHSPLVRGWLRRHQAVSSPVQYSRDLPPSTRRGRLAYGCRPGLKQILLSVEHHPSGIIPRVHGRAVPVLHQGLGVFSCGGRLSVSVIVTLPQISGKTSIQAATS